MTTDTRTPMVFGDGKKYNGTDGWFWPNLTGQGPEDEPNAFPMILQIGVWKGELTVEQARELRDLRGYKWWSNIDFRVIRRYLAEQEGKAPPAEPAPRAKQAKQRKPSLAAKQADDLIDSLRQATAALLEAEKRAFDESMVERWPAGDARGGQFAPQGGGGQSVAPAEDPKGGEWTTVDVGSGEELYYVPQDFQRLGASAATADKKWFSRADIEANPALKQAVEKLLSTYGLTLGDLERVSTLEGMRARIIFDGDFDTDGGMPQRLYVQTKYETFAEGYPIGEQSWTLTKYAGKIEAEAALLVLEEKYQDRGIAESLQGRQFELAIEKRFGRILTQADITIGKYAWAKAGFQYADPSLRARRATNDFRRWCSERKIELESWPTFRTPQDVINFEAPGVKIPYSQIENAAAKQRDYGLGAAFMLDKKGHGAWNAVYDLSGMWEEKT